MFDTNGLQAVTTTGERKPPTLADIVREKTDDGRRIIDFFLDVMEDRIDGAELCHRIDAAKQLEKHKSKAAARFLAKYRGVSCGHSINGRPNPADPCSAAERSLVAVPLNAPATLTQDFLTVLSGIDEFLMARLIRAQTADGSTVIEFLDDVMQDRNDGFKCHHRIAAAKELIVHIVRDEYPASVHPEPREIVVPAESLPRTRYGAGTQGGGGGRSTVANSVRAEPRQIVVPAEAGTQGGSGGRSTAANPARTEPVLSAVEGSAHPELVEAQPVEGGPTSVHPEPVEGPRPEFTEGSADSSSVVPAKEPAEGPQDKARRTRTRRTRTQRRRDGAARAATLGKRSERTKEKKQDKPASVELTPAERRMREKLGAHWHEPDPWAGPIDSTTPGRSPPW